MVKDNKSQKYKVNDHKNTKRIPAKVQNELQKNTK